MKLKNAAMTMAVAGSLWGMEASAQFTYNPGDLFVSFRTAGGNNDLIVDIGSASLYQSAPSSPFAISGVNSTTLNSVFGSMDGIYWSVFGFTPGNSLFTTSARTDINQQTDAPASAGSSSQGISVSYMQGVLNGATSGANNTTVLSSSVVEIQSGLNQSGDISYSVGVVDPNLGANKPGDWHGSWDQVENFTGSGFAASGTSSVSDLYQNDPGNPLTTSGAYLGNFALGNDGDLTFSSGIAPAPEPATWGMFGTGMLTLIAIRRIGRKNRH